MHSLGSPCNWSGGSQATSERTLADRWALVVLISCLGGLRCGVCSPTYAHMCMYMSMYVLLIQSLHSEARLAWLESHFSCTALGKLNTYLGFSFFTCKIRVTLLFLWSTLGFIVWVAWACNISGTVFGAVFLCQWWSYMWSLCLSQGRVYWVAGETANWTAFLDFVSFK